VGRDRYALTRWTWDPKAEQWEEGFRRLQEHANCQGHTRVSQSYTFDGYQLGAWVAKQRQDRTKGILDPDRQNRLQELPGWTWDPFADYWEEGFSRLVEYVERHGDPRVPASYRTEGFNLGLWVGNQRNLHNKGTLRADREGRLTDLPGWTWDSRADKWDEGFNRLMDYVKRHGDARVPASYTVDGYQLGAWVTTRRSLYSKGTLDAGREGRLQKVPGWIWKARSST
jgi:hypothetical protein